MDPALVGGAAPPTTQTPAAEPARAPAQAQVPPVQVPPVQVPQAQVPPAQVPPATLPASPPATLQAEQPTAPAPGSTRAAARTANAPPALYTDPDYQPLPHTPDSLREWTGAHHDRPTLRRITPNPRGLPVEPEAPRRKGKDSPATRIGGETRQRDVPANGSDKGRDPPAAMAQTPTMPAGNLSRLEPFEVDPALTGIPPAPNRAPAPAPVKAETPAGAGAPIVAGMPATATSATPRPDLAATAAPPALVRLGDANLEIEARQLEGAIDQTVTASGEAYIRKGWDELFGDVLRWNIATREASGEGNIVKRDRDSEVTGSGFVFNQETRKGKIDDAAFSLVSLDAKGTASSLRFDGPGRYIGDDGVRYTTCDFNDPDWLLKADSIEIDQNANEGVARNATLLGGGKYPLFYLPRYQFALKNIRKSGFLTPMVSFTNRTGPQIFIPYYWNIAPNYDATLTSRLMAQRGLQVSGEFRYLGDNLGGEARAEYVPDDRQFGDHRWALAFDHRHRFSDRLSGVIDYQQVSDDFYFRDLRNTIGASGAASTPGVAGGTDPGAIPGVRGGTATRLLPQTALLDYAGDGWNLSSQIRSFQVLQPDAVNRVIQPYQSVPNVRFTGAQRIADLVDSRLLADFTQYALRYPEPGAPRREGNRTILNPSLSLPVRTTWGFIEPKLSYHVTHYALDPVAGLSDTFTRSVPTATFDSGLTFERKATDAGAVQTFEPRLFYAYTPFRDQTGLPVFDTGRFDFNFAEIFSANRFVGQDRIGDANQVTAGFTSRYIDNLGTERLKVTLAQRLTLSDLRVADDIRSIVDRSANPPGAVPAPQRGVSDVLGEFSGRLTRDTSVVSRVQYNTDAAEVRRGLVALRYSPEMGKVINLGYRYTREISDAQLGLEQVDFSTQWPITSRLYALARTNYSLLESRATESLFGLEYYGSCWSVRTVVQSLATSASTTTRALFIVLELNGLTGTDPSTYNAILNRHIGGYNAVNPDQTRTTEAMLQ